MNLNRKQLAERYGVSLRTVDRWVRRRRISYMKIGRSVRFKSDVVDSEMSSRYGIHAR